MSVNSAWLVRVRGARPPPFTTFTITYKDAVYAPAEWADIQYTLTLSIYVLCGPIHRVHRVVLVTFWRAFQHDGKISPASTPFH